jgi:hypothetical protein
VTRCASRENQSLSSGSASTSAWSWSAESASSWRAAEPSTIQAYGAGGGPSSVSTNTTTRRRTASPRAVTTRPISAADTSRSTNRSSTVGILRACSTTPARAVCLPMSAAR